MKQSFISVLFSLASIVNAQNSIKIKRVICSADSKKPLEYVNVGVVDVPIGTITNKNGAFTLELNDNIDYKINISFVGYESKLFSIVRLQKTDTIFLRKALYELKEVIVKKNVKPIKIGSFSEGSKLVTGWAGSYGQGHERGILIKNKNKKLKINNVNFYVASNECDSIKVRVKIREFKNNIPFKDVLTENIIETIKIKRGWVKIDLEEFAVIVDKDVVVSLEWLYSNKKCEFYLPLTMFKGRLYAKEAGETKWTIKKMFSPSIYVNSSLIE